MTNPVHLILGKRCLLEEQIDLLKNDHRLLFSYILLHCDTVGLLGKCTASFPIIFCPLLVQLFPAITLRTWLINGSESAVSVDSSLRQVLSDSSAL